MDPITIIQKLYAIAQAIYQQKQKIKANHEQFGVMTERVHVIVEMLRALKSDKPNPLPG